LERFRSQVGSLTLEGEAGADLKDVSYCQWYNDVVGIWYLVAGLVELLCIEGGADAEGEASVDLGVVGEGGDAAIVDLGLITS